MKNSIAMLILLTLVACSSETSTSDVAADTLYTNGVIWTGASGAPDASVMAVKGGDVTYVGDGQDVKIVANETVDLGGRFVMPGFIDNHVHFLDGGAALASVDLRDAATPEEFTKRIIDYAGTLPQGRWVLNGNWDHEWWGGELPRKEWIDAATPDTPVFIHRLDGHMALANSAALKLAGVDAATATPDGGEIVHDATGEPTGILKDNAMDLVFAAIPPMSTDEKLAVFELAQSHALSLGLTEVHAVTNGPMDAEMLDTFRLAHDRGLMKIRIYALTPIDNWESARDRVAREGYGDDLLRWGGLKGFVDGSLGSTTAWFYEPFTDVPETSGFPLGDPESLKATMADADAAGLKLAVHAIGDQAIDVLIENMRAVAGADIKSRRYRIEHFQHPSTAAIEKAAESGIIASMQPYHAIDDGRWAEKRIGSERIKTTYAFRSLLDAGVILSFGSDWPVAPLSPLAGVYAAVTRQTIDGLNPDGWQAQEKITVEEALSAYTAANAYSGFEEDRAGTLETGKRADFVTLSDDPRTVVPADIRNIEVLETVIDGVSVFKK